MSLNTVMNPHMKKRVVMIANGPRYVRPLQLEPLAPVVVEHHRRRLAARFDPLVVNRRRLRATISPVMIHDELAAYGSDEPVEKPVGVVGILAKLDRVCSRAVPKDKKAGGPLHGAEHRPIRLTSFRKGTPNDVGSLVGRERLWNCASPAFQFRDQVLRQFGKGRGREPNDGVFAFGWRISWGLTEAWREGQNQQYQRKRYAEFHL